MDKIPNSHFAAKKTDTIYPAPVSRWIESIRYLKVRSAIRPSDTNPLLFEVTKREASYASYHAAMIHCQDKYLIDEAGLDEIQPRQVNHCEIKIRSVVLRKVAKKEIR